MNDFPTCLRHPKGDEFVDDMTTYAQGDTALGDLQGYAPDVHVDKVQRHQSRAASIVSGN